MPNRRPKDSKPWTGIFERRQASSTRPISAQTREAQDGVDGELDRVDAQGVAKVDEVVKLEEVFLEDDQGDGQGGPLALARGGQRPDVLEDAPVVAAQDDVAIGALARRVERDVDLLAVRQQGLLPEGVEIDAVGAQRDSDARKRAQDGGELAAVAHDGGLATLQLDGANPRVGARQAFGVERRGHVAFGAVLGLVAHDATGVALQAHDEVQPLEPVEAGSRFAGALRLRPFSA